MSRKQKKALARILAALILLAVLWVLPYVPGMPVLPKPVWLIIYMVPYLTVGYDILIKAVKGILNRQVFDEQFLMSAATIGAIALGEYREGVAVMLFYQIGELFQSIAVGRSRRSISELMDIRPDYANVESEDGTITQMDPDEVEIGTLIVVSPGEKIPIDGIVEEGHASLNTSALTGESAPKDVAEGDAVISGCISTNGVLKIRTTKEFGESTVSKILELVEDSGLRKSKSEKFISRFAKYYTPVVCFSALALAVGVPLIRLMMGSAPEWGTWVYRALTFLVISCPCALVVSIPLTFFAGIGGAGREGILVKGAQFLESLADTRMVVFDKTGTLTKGIFEVAGVHHPMVPEAQLLEMAAHAESFSTHPVGKSIREAYGQPVDRTRVKNVEEIAGGGVVAVVDAVQVACGNEKLMAQIGVAPIPCSHTGTIIHVAMDGSYAGHILIADQVKPHSAEAIRELHRIGVKKTVMLTGDALPVAASVAQELGLSEHYGELLPGDKVDRVETLLLEKTGKDQLIFVGDGINDAPVLSRADIGVAMGAMGSDAAIEAADVVLMDDDPKKVVKAIRIARKCMRIVRENIWIAIGIKCICLILGAMGIADMWLAIFADVGVMVLAVLNAIRALFVRRL